MSSLVLMQVTMTSLELVEFINSQRKNNEALVRHADFLVKVPKVLGEDTNEIFRSSYLAKNGENRPCYKFPKREACLMAMSYSYDIQAKVFDRMTALEDALKGSQPIDPIAALSDPNTLRGLLLGYSEKVIALQSEVNQLAPKAKALETLASGSQDLLCLTDAAKHLHINRNVLTNLLSNKKWIYRRKTSTQRKGAWTAYDSALRQGYLYHDYTEIEKPHGIDYSAQVLVTKKGMAHISQFLAEIEVTA
jgi:phage antirepressor YoqD-like protein